MAVQHTANPCIGFGIRNVLWYCNGRRSSATVTFVSYQQGICAGLVCLGHSGINRFDEMAIVGSPYVLDIPGAASNGIKFHRLYCTSKCCRRSYMCIRMHLIHLYTGSVRTCTAVFKIFDDYLIGSSGSNCRSERIRNSISRRCHPGYRPVVQWGLYGTGKGNLRI